jgi:Protein of unknown function (DUF3455)
MPFRKGATLVLLLLSTPPVSAAAAEVPLPDALAAPGETVVLTAHAVGMQIYECKAGTEGKLAWAFREPLATLIADGKIVGRHFAGPTWELSDGSAVVGRVVASTPGARINDIAWLKLDVVSRSGSGMLANATTIQRINTVGGKLDDTCDRPGDSRSMPYTADYVFLRKG